MTGAMLSREQLGARLNLSPTQLYRNMPQLLRQGFPKPSYGRMRGARWDGAAIEAWLASRTTTAQPHPATAPPANDDAESAALDRRAEALAAGLPRAGRG